MAKVGRPKRVFTVAQIAKIDELALLNCKDYTIANIIGCKVDVLKAHFGKRLIQKRAEWRATLRRNQQKMAENQAAMAIFLGKNDLEQTDKKQIEGNLNVSLAQAVHEAMKGKE